ncbi:hypothetical protein [Sphingomonas sp. BK580]|uniref:hypothetical protein n=1 Tax=Sphingomonas sp. BK580 TaxID=2586972 RepID=UPI00161F6D7B|nr:hypothetical protein [Sphingomonas sp. BK580]MBB3692066.1 hypothetical protein [Sphingomonas sp. BK580]
MDPVDLAREVEIFAECGQRAAIIARQLPDGVLEAVAGLHILAAARVHQELHTEAIVEVIVDLHVMSAEDPYRFATAEMEGGPAVSSLQRGLFYQRAVAALGSEAEVARVCKVHKSTVKRALDVARTVECINDKITIHNQVSQRQAEWFAQHVGFSSDFSDTEDPTTARRLARLVNNSEVVPAATLFRQLRTALNGGRRQSAAVDLMVGDAAVGTISRAKSGRIKIDLTKAGDVDLDTLIAAIHRWIAAARAPSTI